MRIFSCQQCGLGLLFENTRCQGCGASLGYLDRYGELSALVPEEAGMRALADPEASHRWQYCANAEFDVCNWLVPAGPKRLCSCCGLNRHIPNLADPEQREAWRKLEFAKHRLVYSLHRFGLPLGEGSAALRFDFLSQQRPIPPGAHSTIGHASGQVTITTEEADPVQREHQRQKMDEPYRTLIGHFRHEVGHYYWDHLVAPEPDHLEQFRRVFGDETADYQQSLNRHYKEGPRLDWQKNYISAYASSHPWEDWAESWAHYFHLIDTLETAHAFGLSLQPRLDDPRSLTMRADIDPYRHRDLAEILRRALPLTFAVNSLNRSMGQPDLYPFVLTAAVEEKMGFIHELIARFRHRAV